MRYEEATAIEPPATANIDTDTHFNHHGFALKSLIVAFMSFMHISDDFFII